MNVFRGLLFTIFWILLAVYTASATCPPFSYNVVTYGAVANDAYGDSAAFQSAVNAAPAYGVICVPAGVYLIDDQININRDHLTIQGAGMSSVLRLPNSINVTMIKIGNPSSPAVTAHDITIEKLAFDGNTNQGLTSTGGNFFGLWVQQGEYIDLHDLYFEDFFNESITVANGEAVNKHVTVERVRTERIKRNGMHMGFAEDSVIRNCIFENNQDYATWGAAAGNGIDVEVEGYDPPTNEGGWVKRQVIEDTLLTNNNLNSAGACVALQPAYGPIEDITLQRNICLEKGIGSLGANAYSTGGSLLRNTDIKINSNWISDVNATAAIAGAVFVNTDGGEFNDNVITNYSSGYFSMLRLGDSSLITGYNNSVYRPTQTSYLWNNVIFVDAPYTANVRVRFYSTYDNGWSGSRIVHYDWSSATLWAASVIGISSSAASFTTNSNSTPTASPSISSASVSSGNLVASVSDPNSLPIRVVALRNGFPIGMKTAVSGTATIPLPSAAVSGDYFEVRAYNHHGIRATDYTFTY